MARNDVSVGTAQKRKEEPMSSLPTIKPLSVMVTSVVVAMSLVACQQGTLTSSVKRDGSLEFVAAGQVTQSNVTGGIAVDSYQGLAIDPTGMEAGSMHIQVVDVDGSGTANTDSEDSGTDSADGGVTNDGSGDQGPTENAPHPEEDKTGEANGTESPKGDSETDSSKGGKGESSDVKVSGEALSGAIDTTIEDVTPQDGTTVFSRTFSSMDVLGEGEDGIVTVTDIPSGYYVVFVSADHATGTLKVRSYDLTDEELADRETKVAMDKVKGWFRDLGLLSDEVSGGTR